MTRALMVTYIAMAIWLVFASAGRVALFIGNNQEMDLLPFLGFLLGILALLLLIPYHDRWLRKRDREDL